MPEVTAACKYRKCRYRANTDRRWHRPLHKGQFALPLSPSGSVSPSSVGTIVGWICDDLPIGAPEPSKPVPARYEKGRTSRNADIDRQFPGGIAPAFPVARLDLS